MAESDENVVSRWSRRKRGRRADPAVDTVAPLEPAGARRESALPGEARDVATTPDDSEVAALPDPDTLDAEADFTVFMKENVPEAIRRRALRRLWRLNPVLANLDGLNDYDDDFTDAATVVAGLKTLYQVGKGFVIEEEKKDEAEKSGEPVAEADARPDDSGPDSDETPAPEEIAPEEIGAEPTDSAPGDMTAIARPPAPDRQVAQQVNPPAAPRRGALERRWGREED